MEKSLESKMGEENPPPYNQGYGQQQPPPAYGNPPVGYAPQQQAGGYPPQQQGGYPKQQPQQGGGYPQQQYQPMQQPMTNQPATVVYMQPSAPLTNPPPDYLCFNIFVTICCCWPIGIFAIMKSVETREATNRGDQDRAVNGSRSAKKLGFITLGVGIAMAVLSAVLTGIYVWFIISNTMDDYDNDFH